VGLQAPVRSYIDGLVHPSAQQGALTPAALRRSTVEQLRIEPRLPGAAAQPSNTLVNKSA
jgi:hypothetical protein